MYHYFLLHGHILLSGKSNIVSGLAKAIKDHFRKLPFVIVNVKGRAKGTSVQELVLKLEVAHAEIPSFFYSSRPCSIIFSCLDQ